MYSYEPFGKIKPFRTTVPSCVESNVTRHVPEFPTMPTMDGPYGITAHWILSHSEGL